MPSIGIRVEGADGAALDSNYKNYALASEGSIRMDQHGITDETGAYVYYANYELVYVSNWVYLGPPTYQWQLVWSWQYQDVTRRDWLFWRRHIARCYIAFDKPYSSPPLVALRCRQGANRTMNIVAYNQEGGRYVGAHIMGYASNGISWQTKTSGVFGGILGHSKKWAVITFPYGANTFPLCEYQIYVPTESLPIPYGGYGVKVTDANGKVTFSTQYKYLKIAGKVIGATPYSGASRGFTHDWVGPELPYYIVGELNSRYNTYDLGFYGAGNSSVTLAYMKPVLIDKDTRVYQSADVLQPRHNFHNPNFNLIVVDPN